MTAPVVRLAVADGQAERTGSISRPVVRRTKDRVISDGRPALLTAFVFIEGFLRRRAGYAYRDWALDSGAFSAHVSGVQIDLAAYVRKCRELRATDPTLTEIFALDVIGDWRASLRNTERMWKAGIQAIPCYHYGEPRDVLRGLAKDYPKIALGGVARQTRARKLCWALDCFAVVWPKRIHGFGFGDAEHLMTVPFHSADASSWEIGACGFGQWKQFGSLRCKGSWQNLRGEVNWFLELERKLRTRWRREMSEL